jgi:hypothetical protein
MDGLLNPNIAQLNQLLTLGSLPFLLNQGFPLNQVTNNNQLELNVNEERDQRQRNGRSLSPAPYSPNVSLDDDTEYATSERGLRTSFNRIFVSYPRDATEYELNLAFKRFGTILDTLIIRDRHSKIDKG